MVYGYWLLEKILHLSYQTYNEITATIFENQTEE